MYCSYCGCKLNSTAKKCPSCGNDARSEYCGGFWGLVGEKEQQKSEPVVEKKNAEETQSMPVDSKNEEKNTGMKKRKRTSQKIVIGILLVSVLLCIIQTVRLTVSNGKLSDMLDENQMISQENGELMIEKEEAEKKCDELLAEKEEAEKKCSELVEEKTEVEKQNGSLESENKKLKAFNFKETNNGFLKSRLQIQGVE